MLPNQLEIPCQAIEMSPEQAMLVSAHAPNIGDRAIIYLDNVGRIEGNISGHFSGGFAMEIDCTPRKRDKLAGYEATKHQVHRLRALSTARTATDSQ